jgi:hypothetical protein
VLLKRLAQVHRSLLELIEYQLPCTKALANVFFDYPDTTTPKQSYESHVETRYYSLRIHLDLLAEQICLDLEQFYQNRQDLEGCSFRTMG